LETSKKTSTFFIELLNSTQEKQDPCPILQTIGFKTEGLSKIKPQLNEFLKIQLQPFLTTEPLEYKNWKRKEKTEQLLSKEHRWDFMTSAPEDYFLFLRAMSGFLYWWRISDTPIQVSEITKSWIQKSKALTN
jgi:hypothetical protein